jgi:hypothetical protein
MAENTRSEDLNITIIYKHHWEYAICRENHLAIYHKDTKSQRSSK